MSFSDAPFNVMTVSSRVLPKQGDSSNMPRFDMCSKTQQRMRADIFMLSKGFDYRLFIKTCKKLKSSICIRIEFSFAFIITRHYSISFTQKLVSSDPEPQR